ncbi:MAG: hypothetical protein GY938_14090 [Ketobacter sp.]|nr:hypothetical protein [Ketobacter sp.]
MPLFNLELASLAKLLKSEIDCASNHGIMPPSGGGVFGFVAAGLAKLGEEQLCQSKCLSTGPS